MKCQFNLIKLFFNFRQPREDLDYIFILLLNIVFDMKMLMKQVVCNHPVASGIMT